MDRAVGNACQFLVVRHDDKRLSILVTQVEEELMQLGLVLGVETTRRLVGQNHGRIVDQSTGYGHTLLLASRKFIGLMLCTLPDFHKIEQFQSTLTHFLFAFSGNESRQHDIFQSRKFRQQLMELKDKAYLRVAELRQSVPLQSGHVNPVNQHLSGIATATAQAVVLVEGTAASIADTRKTLPGIRALQKYAVTVGGGKNHRFNLSDAAMLKDNHIDAAGGITPAITKLRSKIGHMTKIEVETRNLEEVKEALNAGADIIMLDNMDPDAMRQAVELTAGRAKLEASGNITAETLRAVAQTGVDIISMGALTHSVKAFDISMKIQ